MSPKAARSLAICSDFSERRGQDLNGNAQFTPTTIAVGESVRTLVVSAG
jgi:hypothetical protein